MIDFLYGKKARINNKKIIKKKKEKKKKIIKKYIKLNDGKDHGIFAPPMKAQTAVDELCRYFLGEEWYSLNPISTEQINTEIVYEIECKFKKYKKIKKKVI